MTKKWGDFGGQLSSFPPAMRHVSQHLWVPKKRRATECDPNPRGGCRSGAGRAARAA